MKEIFNKNKLACFLAFVTFSLPACFCYSAILAFLTFALAVHSCYLDFRYWNTHF